MRGDLPNLRILPARLGVINGSAVVGFYSGESTHSRNLDGLPAAGWHFPDLVLPGSIGRKIDPATVWRPAWRAATSQIGELHEGRSVLVAGPDLEAAGTIRHERQFLAIWR